MTLYEELELLPDCTFEQIKQQYRTLARTHHPDLGGDEEKFKRIKFAYEVLSDPVRRKQYDENKTTDTKPDMRHEAINQLANVFTHVMSNFDPNNGSNLIEQMRGEITKQSMLVMADQVTCNTIISKLELTQQKLRMKTESEENIISTFIETQLGWRRKDLDIFKYRLEVLSLMEQILDNYQYGLIELPIFMET